jgi:hypothetical protein
MKKTLSIIIIFNLITNFPMFNIFNRGIKNILSFSKKNFLKKTINKKIPNYNLFLPETRRLIKTETDTFPIKKENTIIVSESKNRLETIKDHFDKSHDKKPLFKKNYFLQHTPSYFFGRKNYVYSIKDTNHEINLAIKNFSDWQLLSLLHFTINLKQKINQINEYHSIVEKKIQKEKYKIMITINNEIKKRSLKNLIDQYWGYLNKPTENEYSEEYSEEYSNKFTKNNELLNEFKKMLYNVEQLDQLKEILYKEFFLRLKLKSKIRMLPSLLILKTIEKIETIKTKNIDRYIIPEKIYDSVFFLFLEGEKLTKILKQSILSPLNFKLFQNNPEDYVRDIIENNIDKLIEDDKIILTHIILIMNDE